MFQKLPVLFKNRCFRCPNLRVKSAGIQLAFFSEPHMLRSDPPRPAIKQEAGDMAYGVQLCAAHNIIHFWGPIQIRSKSGHGWKIFQTTTARLVWDNLEPLPPDHYTVQQAFKPQIKRSFWCSRVVMFLMNAIVSGSDISLLPSQVWVSQHLSLNFSNIPKTILVQLAQHSLPSGYVKIAIENGHL